jgi:hypothetical protein
MKGANMKQHLPIGVLAALLMSMPALANDCMPEIIQFDEQLFRTPPVPSPALSEAQRLRDQGLVLCETGRVDEGLAALNAAKTRLDEASTTLGIQ